MKKIFWTALTEMWDGTYSWREANEAELGHEWAGDVVGYVANLDFVQELYHAVHHSECGTIHRVPADDTIVLLDEAGIPVEMYWSVDVEDEQ